MEETVKLDLDKLKKDIIDLKIEKIFGEPAFIDLTAERAQEIDSSFTIFIDEVEPHLTGIKIKGGII